MAQRDTSRVVSVEILEFFRGPTESWFTEGSTTGQCASCGDWTRVHNVGRFRPGRFPSVWTRQLCSACYKSLKAIKASASPQDGIQ